MWSFRFITLLFFVHYINAYCIPCPSSNITLEQIEDCTCPFGSFLDNKNDCVEFTNCPTSEMLLAIQQFLAMIPVIEEPILESFSKFKMGDYDFDKDIDLTMSTVENRLSSIKEDLPEILGPIMGGLVVHNKEIFEQCKGDTKCALFEILKKPSNLKYIAPKLKDTVENLAGKALKISSDIKGLAKSMNCDYLGHCSLIKGLADMLEKMPSPSELQSLSKILLQFVKSNINDLSKHFPVLPTDQFF